VSAHARSSSAVIDVFRNLRLRLCDRCECYGRAIIHNNDYKSIDDAKVAIDRYFAERNDHFRQHPRRAGRKIWGKEREPAAFTEANNCKDPRYR
jgi:hypothetical protein